MIDLVIYAETLDDQERARIALENRIRSMAEKGLIDPFLTGLNEQLQALEHEATKGLKRELRKHPLGPWVKRTVGIGEKQAARLLAVIGDPCQRPERDEEGELTGNMVPRTVGQLWAYCGFHVVDGQAPKRKRGVQGNWNETARMRTRMVAESAIKAGVRKSADCNDENGYDLGHRTAISPYGQVYLDGRAQYADLELTDLHKHNRALRLVAKAILRDMWIEANNLDRDHSSTGTQEKRVPVNNSAEALAAA